jgi:hypothetical protein
MAAYPVTFEADYAPKRSRLSVLFRFILVLPLYVWAYFYGIAAFIAIAIAWVALVITGQYPQGLYGFVAGYTRFSSLLMAYVTLLTDEYPPFLGSQPPAGYPVRMDFERLSHYSRLKTLFRIILAIPIVILRYVMGLLLEIGAFASWVVIILLGRLPRGLFDLMVLANSYTARSDAYIYLLTETYPPFQDEGTRTAGLAG